MVSCVARLFCKYLFIKLNINSLLGRNIAIERGYAFVTGDSNEYILCVGGGGGGGRQDCLKYRFIGEAPLQ